MSNQDSSSFAAKVEPTGVFGDSSALGRRVIRKPQVRILFTTADEGVALVEGVRIGYACMPSEWWEELLRYASQGYLQRREFLLGQTTSGDWCPSSDQPVYVVGWPDGVSVRIVGAKKTVAYLRRNWPERDFSRGGSEEEEVLVSRIGASR